MFPTNRSILVGFAQEDTIFLIYCTEALISEAQQILSVFKIYRIVFSKLTFIRLKLISKHILYV